MTLAIRALRSGDDILTYVEHPNLERAWRVRNFVDSTGMESSEWSTRVRYVLAHGSRYALAPVMAPLVYEAAETMPYDECVRSDDMPERHGYIYLGDNPEVIWQRNGKNCAVDTIMWTPNPFGGHKDGLSVWIFGATNLYDNRIAINMGAGVEPRSCFLGSFNILFDMPVNGVNYVDVHGKSATDDNTESLRLLLSMARIMQQSYSVTTPQVLSRQVARARQRHNQPTEVGVIELRKIERPDRSEDGTGHPLETRHVRRSHWRRHQRYKNAAGEWSEKSILIAETVVGPDGAPWVIHPKVSVLKR